MIRKKKVTVFSLCILTGFSTPPGPFVGGVVSESSAHWASTVVVRKGFTSVAVGASVD